MKPEPVTFQFIGYNPVVVPMGGSQGGGFKLTMLLSDSEWENIKEINSPRNQGLVFQVALVGVVQE